MYFHFDRKTPEIPEQNFVDERYKGSYGRNSSAGNNAYGRDFRDDRNRENNKRVQRSDSSSCSQKFRGSVEKNDIREKCKRSHSQKRNSCDHSERYGGSNREISDADTERENYEKKTK